MPDLVIRGGRVVDQSGERVADVLVRGGHVVEVGAGLSGERDPRRVGVCRRAGARRPPRAPARAGHGGSGNRRDRRARRRARRLHRGRRDAQHRARHSMIRPSSRRCWRRGRAPRAPCCRRGASRRGEKAMRWRRWVSCTTSVCGSSPTTARASPTPASCATRSSTRWRSRVRSSPSTPKTPASRATARCTRARGPAASAFPAGPPPRRTSSSPAT